MLKENTITRANTKTLANFIALSSVITFLPFFVHLQWLSGPLVNTLLILTLFLVGIRSALVLCVIPSMMALSGGLLPVILAPALPFIMLSNMILLISLDFIYQNAKDKTRGFLLGSVIGSSAKAAFLFFSVALVVNLLPNPDLASKVAKMFSYPQLFSALSGCGLAFIVLKTMKSL